MPGRGSKAGRAPRRARPHCSAFAAASVDGRISLANRDIPNWTSEEDWKFFQASLARSDAVVVGRKTYEAAAERLRKRNTFVLSSRPKTLTRRGTVTFVNPARVSVSKLLAEYRRVAVIGGGAVYRYMLESRLLDEIFVTIEPLIFGRGKEMFIGCTRTTRLQLLSVKRLNRSGTLLLRYRIVQTGRGGSISSFSPQGRNAGKMPG